MIEWHPKPVKGDWNGSGMHANFSNGAMRDVGGKDLFDKICEAFGQNIEKHMSVYGAMQHVNVQCAMSTYHAMQHVNVQCYMHHSIRTSKTCGEALLSQFFQIAQLFDSMLERTQPLEPALGN